MTADSSSALKNLPPVRATAAAQRFVGYACWYPARHAGANEKDRNVRPRRVTEHVEGAPAVFGDLRIDAVGEDHHRVAGGVEDVEGAKQADALIDRVGDDRALIGEAT